MAPGLPRIGARSDGGFRRPSYGGPPGPAVDYKALVEYVARALVDKPDAVKVDEVPDGNTTVYELEVDEEDIGKVIGRQGRTAKAIRTLLSAGGMKLRKRFTLEIHED